MALHPELPRSPYALLEPAHRWFPADEALRASSYERLLPPLVARIREEVAAWRDSGYAGASDTSRALLRWGVRQRACGAARRRHGRTVPRVLRAARGRGDGDLALRRERRA